MSTVREIFLDEVNKYKVWQEQVPTESRFMEWQCEYDYWEHVYNATSHILEAIDVDDWDDTLIHSLIFIIEADQWINRITYLANKHPEKLIHLAKYSLQSNLPDAKWQLALELSAFASPQSEAENLLLAFAQDEDEYTRRMALKALAKANSPLVEQLIEPAWSSGDEYQRIMVLFALRQTESANLEKYLTLADDDGREYLVNYALKIRRGGALD